MVQYIGAACVVLVGAAVVVGILYKGGVIGGGEVAETDANDDSSKSTSDRRSTTGTDIAITAQSFLVSETLPPDGLQCQLTVTKGKDELVASSTDVLLWAPYYRIYRGPPVERGPTLIEPPTSEPKAIGATEFKPLLDYADRLERIARAMFAYQLKWGALPSSYQRGQGLSWRVHLLPMLGEDALFQKFKLNEPWDSPHNKPLIAEMPDVFQSSGTTETGKTSTHLFVGQGTPFGAAPTKRGRYAYHIKYRIRNSPLDPNTKYKFSLKLVDRDSGPQPVFEETRVLLGSELQGNSEYVWRFSRDQPPVKGTPTEISEIDYDTICAVVAGPETAAEWTKPGGLKIDPFEPAVKLGTIPKTGLPVVYFNGKFAALSQDIDQPTLVLMAQHIDDMMVRPPFGANVTYSGKSALYLRHEQKFKRSELLIKRFLDAMNSVQDAATARIAAAKITQITKDVQQNSKSELPLLPSVEKRILTFQMKRKTLEFAIQYRRADARALLRGNNDPKLKAAIEKLKAVFEEIRNKKTKPLI